jgi:hypothetical protein
MRDSTQGLELVRQACYNPYFSAYVNF